MDFSKTLFRCSSIGHLMTEPVSKAAKEAGELSEGCKTHLIDIYVSAKYDRQSDVSNKYFDKGNMVEEDSITLYSRLKKRFFKKNSEPLTNEFIKGTPDLYTGKEITNAEKIIELKSSWDIFTFFRVHTKALNNLYYWQIQGYLALTGAKVGKLAYCLINTPETLINDEKRKLFYKMNAGTEENSDYKAACLELEKNMIYDDIPMEDRMIEFKVERNEADIEKLYAKIKKARRYLNDLEGQLTANVMVAEQIPELSATIIEGTNIPLIKI